MKVSVRFNSEEQLLLQYVKQDMGIVGTYGEDSQAIKQALRVYVENRTRVYDDFNDRYKGHSRDLIFKLLKKEAGE